mmetsp:Transcript_27351/g.62796  ORF Transcript_27351/g.62796 Transcript_27351/m.62796 type:complete len:143 (-) Transcript_27351:380-808(-)
MTFAYFHQPNHLINASASNSFTPLTFSCYTQQEFKESERQRSEFRRLQLQQKAKFTVVLERFTNDSKTEEQLGDDLADLKQLCKITGGLPLGIKRDDIVKTVRRKKALGFWPTSVEYGYQALIREIDFQQSPNKDKDVGNPL